jgi:hypothetical protein
MLTPSSARVVDIARCGFWFATLLALAGCGSKDDLKYPDVSAYCRGRGEAECAKEVLLACAVSDAQKCVTSRQAACIDATPKGAVYNPNGAESCIQAVSSAFADAKLSAQENRTVGEACTALFDGSGSVDAVCKKDIDCKVSAGLRCVLRGGSDSGSCQVPLRVTGGGVCSAANQCCIAGFHCGSTNHCDVNSQVDELCSEVLPCLETARCNAGKCERKLADGSPCSSDEECLNALCARGTGAAQGLCVSQMTLAPNEPFCIDVR